MTWELVSDNPSYSRLSVPGGWLVLVSGASLAFVPDATHSWVVGTPAPTPVPTPTPVSTKWIGTNLMPVTDWATDQPFTNYFYKSRAWISGTWNTWDDGRALNLDAQGNVLSLIGNGDQQAKSVIFTTARPSGNFILTWTGSGSFAWSGATVVSSTANSQTITPAASGNVVLMLLTTDPTNPVKNIKLVRASQSAVTSFWNPDFLSDMSEYSCIRFMDWQCTNFSRTVASMAKDFVPLSSLPIRFTNSPDSVPVEVMIDLCNKTKCNAWFCMPMQATDSYLDNFIALVKAKLDPALTAYFEHSNEVWNGAFPQNALQGGATFTDKMNLHALATSKLAGKVKTALGARGLTTFGAQSPNLGTQDAPLATIKNTAGATMPDLLATAPYFGYGLPDSLAIFTDGRLNTSITGVINEVKASKTIADKYGIGLVCYEGGCTVMPGAVVNRDPKMKDAYITYLHGIKAANPGKVFNHYAYISPYDNSGSWGAREAQYQASTPKEAGILSVIAEP